VKSPLPFSNSLQSRNKFRISVLGDPASDSTSQNAAYTVKAAALRQAQDKQDPPHSTWPTETGNLN
jgi:hypothetical protein